MTDKLSSVSTSEESPVEKQKPTVLVLGGATGMLGQAMTAAVQNRGWNIHTLGREDGAVTDPFFLEDYLSRINPDFIFNTIAYTDIDQAEEEKEKATVLNRGFPALLGSLVRGSDAHLIHFSTNQIFNGKKNTPYTEDDTPDPLNIYGASKLAGEQALQALNMSNCCIVRTAWLFGPGRLNFITRILQMAHDEVRKDTITAVHDHISSPTYTVDLAIMALALAEKKASGIVHAVNTGHASWCELACEALSVVKPDVRVQPIPCRDWPHKARRPQFSTLSTSRLTALTGITPRPWPQALREYIFGLYAEAATH